MGAGMGMTMAPATESVMGSLPREKAGVGSAVNDTTRQVGGALGVAVIGSVVTSVYTSRIATLSAGAGLDEQATAAAESSIAGAQRVGAALGGQASSFVADANQIFVDSMAVGMRISAVVIFFAAVMVWKFLPARATSHVASSKTRDAVAVSTDPFGSDEPANVAVAPPATATLATTGE
jgi:hypothetical protein